MKFVYAIGWFEDGPVKIGVAGNVGARLMGIQNGCPYRLQVFRSLPCREPGFVEAEAHQRLAARRMESEWFSCSAGEAEQAIRFGIGVTTGDWSGLADAAILDLASEKHKALCRRVVEESELPAALRNFARNLFLSQLKSRPIVSAVPDLTIAVADAYRSGEAVRATSARLGINSRTFYMHLNAAGLERRRPRSAL